MTGGADETSGSAAASVPARPATIGRRDAALIAVASAVAAGSSFVVLPVASRVLELADNTVFLTFWSMLFVCFGVLSGVSIETTRAVTASARPTAVEPTSRRPRVLTVGLGTGLLVGAVLALSAVVWAPRLFPQHAGGLGALVAVGAAGYAVHSVVVGSLAGNHRWGAYARLVGAESAVRLALILVAAVLGAALLGFAAGAALAAFTWVLFLALSPAVRRSAQSRADSSLPVFARRLTAAAVATGASAMLVVGFPVLLSLTTSHTQYVGSAPLLAAISLTRAPLMIPLNAYQGVAVSHFVEHRDQGVRTLLPVVRLVVIIGVAGAALAYLAGPWLMELLLGDGYRVSGPVLGALTLAAIGLACLTLTGALCQAATLHAGFVTGWVVAVVVAVGILLVPGALETRAVLALGIGPLVGIVVHLVALRRAGAPSTAPTAPPAAAD